VPDIPSQGIGAKSQDDTGNNKATPIKIDYLAEMR